MRSLKVVFPILLFLLLFVPQGIRAKKVVSYTSTADGSLFFQKSSLPFGKEPLGSRLVRIDAGTHFQKMDGFGAALTGSSCYNLMRMTPEDRKAFLQQTFSKNMSDT